MTNRRALAAGLLALLMGAPLPCGAADATAAHASAYPGVLELAVDASDTERRVMVVHEVIPVAPGPLVLLLPRWIPGRHGPAGTVERLVGLRLQSMGAPLEWLRDTLDAFAFHVSVPPGATQIEAEFEYLKTPDGDHDRTFITAAIERVQWNELVLYPSGYAARGITVHPSLVLPSGWDFATALTLAQRGDARLEFAAVPLDVLLDSPVLAGRQFARVDLDAGGKQRVSLDLAAEHAAQLAVPAAALAAHRALVQQTYRLFRSRHFGHYDFLVSLSDTAGFIALEHQQSSEVAVSGDYFSDWSATWNAHQLLAHEFVHAWNGKFRRPSGLATPSFEVPMQDSLLWMYEGQTDYWGMVLSARSAMITADQAREGLAELAAELEGNPGRTWRSLQDTTNQPIISAPGRRQIWSSWQRARDYYGEMQLVWLDADTRIRELSGQSRSLDDFARAFFGGSDAGDRVVTYEFSDVVAGLNQVQPFDWEHFLRSRLDTHEHAPLEGIRRAGWRVIFTEEPNAVAAARESAPRGATFRDSIGLSVASDGLISSVRWDGPAYQAHLAPGMKLIAVNGHAFKPPLLRDAIAEAKGSAEPIDLLVLDDDLYRTVHVNYHDGLRYPHLERIAGTPDLLSAILAPLD